MVERGTKRRNGPVSTVGRRLTAHGLDLLPVEVRERVEAELARGGREAWVMAPDDGRVYVEIRNAKA
jgi:hypothetical protein